MRSTATAHGIRYDGTLAFFEAHGRTATTGTAQTATRDEDKALAGKRDTWERDTVLPLLDLRGDERVLDIGCGHGRWAELLSGRVQEYVGVDFSSELLKLAVARRLPRCRFEWMAAQDVRPGAFANPRFDLFICSGILIYLNDGDVSRLAGAIAAMAEPGARVYLRQPMAVTGGRLTFDRFPSTKPKPEYSAVYRTPEQCHELFGAPLRPSGFTCTVEQPLFPPGLSNRGETEQQIQLWTKSA